MNGWMDIEIIGDEIEDQRDALREIAEADVSNSCDALAIIDGVPPPDEEEDD